MTGKKELAEEIEEMGGYSIIERELGININEE